jgi:hypothetical protein
MPNQPPNPEPPQSGAKLKAFLTGMIVAASALVGGLGSLEPQSPFRTPPGRPEKALFL